MEILKLTNYNCLVNLRRVREARVSVDAKHFLPCLHGEGDERKGLSIAEQLPRQQNDHDVGRLHIAVLQCVIRLRAPTLATDAAARVGELRPMGIAAYARKIVVSFFSSAWTNSRETDEMQGIILYWYAKCAF